MHIIGFSSNFLADNRGHLSGCFPWLILSLSYINLWWGKNWFLSLNRYLINFDLFANILKVITICIAIRIIRGDMALFKIVSILQMDLGKHMDSKHENSLIGGKCHTWLVTKDNKKWLQGATKLLVSQSGVNRPHLVRSHIPTQDGATLVKW